MKSRLRHSILTIAIFYAGSLAPATTAHAAACPCWTDAAEVAAGVFSHFTSFANMVTKLFGGTLIKAVTQSSAGVRGELLKTFMASFAVQQGLEGYRQQQDVNRESVRLGNSLAQPPTTCANLSTASEIAAADIKVKLASANTQFAIAERARSNNNSIQAMENSNNTSNRLFCTPEDKANGICELNTSTEYAKLAGADKDATFLFQGPGGASSYEGANTSGKSGQSLAVEGYIDRVVHGTPPEQLRNKSVTYYKSSPQARAYVELDRRYNAMLSASEYSLAQIKEYKTPQRGLGTMTKMDKVPGLPAAGADMSLSDVIERFVASKFSPTTISALAANPEPHIILRDMAQMSAFQLRMSLHGMTQGARTEGLAAQQLILMADQVLRPGVDAQRSIASANMASR